jgi:cellulose synthase/poly-beta-1,6-N-acetylglucosamine synthase-like glycosyltransferase
MRNELNPLFIVAVFTMLIGSTLVSTTSLRLSRLFTLQWTKFLFFVSFILCGWYFNHLTVYWIFLYAALWMMGYWISLYNHSDHFPPGRVILATLMSSIVIYMIHKTNMLLSLQQGWLGYAATLLFGAAEIVFLVLLIHFAWDAVQALSLQLDPASKKRQPTDCDFKPFVSIHLPICNEPVDVVTKTLYALSRLSYPAYEVIVVDNNTDDSRLWTPIREVCELLGFRFIHVNPLSGYKAGALNLALAITSPKACLVAVVDADYELTSNFLEDNVAVFQDSGVAFLQTAQRNRNVQTNKITRAFNPVYDFFYDITMLARSRRNSTMFAGCAGIIRRLALEEAGGWAEWCITEDAELSLRLLARGHKGVYNNCSYGSGFMPETFNDVRKQWFRYFFGGLEIARRHFFPTILARNQLRLMQRLDFMIAGVIILGAAAMLLSAAGIMITALAYSVLQTSDPALAGNMFYLLTVFSSWLIIYNSYQAFGMFLLFLVFRLTYQFSWAEAFNSALSFQSLVTTQAKAAFWVLIGRKYAFVSTPKTRINSTKQNGQMPMLSESLLCISMGIAMLGLFQAAPSKPIVLGYVLLGLWQVLIYGSTVLRAFQSSRDRVHSLTP